MSPIEKHEELEFQKLKTEWEHHRATEFNYTIGLITVIVFGSKYWVFDKTEVDYTLAIASSCIICVAAFLRVIS